MVSLLLIWALVVLGVQILTRTVKNQRWRHKAKRFSYHFGTVSSILSLFFLWSGSGGEVAITLSVVGAGLAFALQQPLVSLAGWLYLITNRPYDVGDRIEINGVSGDVIDIRLFKTVLMESNLESARLGSTQNTGRVVEFPNANLFSYNLMNYTQGFAFVWNEYSVLITFESNWKKALEALKQIIVQETQQFEETATQQMQHMGRNYLIFDDKLAPSVYANILDSGVDLGLRYLTPVRQRRVIRDRISRAVLDLFDREPDLEFAYPTYRIFRREIEEEKIEARRRPKEPPCEDPSH